MLRNGARNNARNDAKSVSVRTLRLFACTVAIARNDLIAEVRTKAMLVTVLPFACMACIAFGLALDPNRITLRNAAPGLFWVTILLVAILVAQQTFLRERMHGAIDTLRMSGVDPAAIFFGKWLAITTLMACTELVLAALFVVMYDVRVHDFALCVVGGACVTIALGACTTAYGSLLMHRRSASTLLPALLFPVASPVLLGGVKLFQVAIGDTLENTDAWLRLLVVFAVVYLTLGSLLFESMLEGAST